MVPRIVAIVALLAVVALYLVFTARRLDRLHERVDSAASALEAQLQRRSVVAAQFAYAQPLLVDLALAVSTAAAEASILRGLHHDRELAENALSRALAAVADRQPEVFDGLSPAAIDMHDEALRATFARRFYNDTVRDALVVRDRRTVRWLGLAGSAPHPSYFEMDDEELPSPRLSVASRT